MARIAIGKELGIDIDGSLSPGARISSLIPDLSRFKDLSLDALVLQKASIKFSIDRPITTRMGDLGLTFGASISTNVEVLTDKESLGLDGDPFSTLQVNQNELYLGLKLSCDVNPEISAGVGPAVFGFSANREFDIACFRRFVRGTAGYPTFGRALGLLLGSFSIPRNASELTQVDEDTVLLIRGSGELSFSASISMETPVQSIAATSIGFGNEMQVQAGGAFGVQAKFSLQGEYGIRLRQPQQKKVELGIYRAERRRSELSVSAQVGLTAGTGDFDLLEKLIDSLSRKPEADKNELNTAIPGDEDDEAKRTEILDFQSQLQSAASGKLEAAITAGISQLRESEPMWMFEIDTSDALPSAARDAITRALGGDFRSLTTNPRSLEPSVTETANVLTITRANELRIQLNLFGIVNALSIVQIARVATIERNASGDITLITDVSDVKRLSALMLNAGWDAKRLRRLLSEEFLLSATYRVAGVGVLPPEFHAQQTYFQIKSASSIDEVHAHLDIARILGLLSRDEEDQNLQNLKPGRITLFAQTSYSGDDVGKTFLDDAGGCRAVPYFENAGRSALGALIAGRPGQEFRAMFASLGSGDALWQKMKDTGNVSEFGPLFGLASGELDPRIATVGTDYLVITSWAKAMSNAARAIYQVESLLSGSSSAPEDERFSRARGELSKRMTEVTRDTHDEFGHPLGLLMVYVASGQRAEKRFLMTGDSIPTIDLKSAALAGRGGG